jgi:hypothetical protein
MSPWQTLEALLVRVRPTLGERTHSNRFVLPQMRTHALHISTDIVTEVKEALSAIPELVALNGGTMDAGNFGLPFGIDDELAKWTIGRMLITDAHSTVQDLIAFVGNRIELTDYLAFTGNTIEKVVELSDNVHLLPMDMVPRYDTLAQALGAPQMQLLAPTGVIRRVRIKSPFVARDLDPFRQRENHELLRELSVVMGVHHSYPVFDGVVFTAVPESVPFGMPGGCSSWIPEIRPSSLPPAPPLTDADIQTLRGYLRLGRATQQRLALPLQRLRLSLIRVTLVDRAVDLGIALESLLIAGDKHTELVETGALRAAILIGGEHLERERSDAVYRKFYNELRSPAVHTGVIETKPLKIKHVGERSAVDLLALAQTLCGSLISRIIELGAFPDWRKTFPSAKDLAMSAEVALEAPGPE